MPTPDRFPPLSWGGPPPSGRHPLRPDDDGDAFRQALRIARQRTGVRCVFGGEIGDGALRLTEFVGTLTDSMRGLRVVPGRGLGGYVIARQRPYAVNDYVPATTITHDYDSPVRREGIRAIVAVPVTVQGGVRGVLYAASRDTAPLGDRTTAALVDTARRLAGEIAVRDEVDRRVRLLERAGSAPPPPSPRLDALRDCTPNCAASPTRSRTPSCATGSARRATASWRPARPTAPRTPRTATTRRPTAPVSHPANSTSSPTWPWAAPTPRRPGI
ncbi:GAF domain-containing protein [Streptomyces albus]